MNVTESDQHHFNGLLLSLQSACSLGELDRREKGYNRIAIDESQLSFFQSAAFSLDFGSVYLYRGKPENQNDNILPNKRYLALCLSGAQQWGELFYEHFLQTTYCDGISLKVFLSDKA